METSDIAQSYRAFYNSLFEFLTYVKIVADHFQVDNYLDYEYFELLDFCEKKEIKENGWGFVKSNKSYKENTDIIPILPFNKKTGKYQYVINNIYRNDFLTDLRLFDKELDQYLTNNIDWRGLSVVIKEEDWNDLTYYNTLNLFNKDREFTTIYKKITKALQTEPSPAIVNINPAHNNNVLNEYRKLYGSLYQYANDYKLLFEHFRIEDKINNNDYREALSLLREKENENPNEERIITTGRFWGLHNSFRNDLNVFKDELDNFITTSETNNWKGLAVVIKENWDNISLFNTYGFVNSVHGFTALYTKLEILLTETILIKPQQAKAITDEPGRLSINQIALKYVYEGLSITRENGNIIAKQYNHNSGEKLFQRFTYYSSAANRKAKPTPPTYAKLKNKIELFNSVIENLHEANKNRALDELNILKTFFENEYQ